MIPSINDIFFYFATLFGINASFVAEQTVVTIDLINKTGQIEYVNLRTPSEDSDFAQASLEEIANATEFDEYFSQLKLTSKSIYKKSNRLNSTIKFSFGDQIEIFDHLYFFPNPDGDIAYRIFEEEKVVSTNGKPWKEDEIDFLVWNKEESQITLVLKRKVSKENASKKMIGLLDYWKE